MSLTLIPAYGRDYKSAKAALADWNANKDFEIANPGHPRYINKHDAEQHKYLDCWIRYNRNQKIVEAS